MEHHEKAGCLFPKIGMRNVKTALAAALCALVYYFLDRNPTFACIGAIFGMGSSFMQSRLHGGNRFFGTMVGGFIGMGLFAIYMELFPDGSNSWVLIPLTFIGVIILILLCQHIWVGGVQPGGVVLCILLFNTPTDTYITYAMNRILDTGIGVLAAIFVNGMLPGGFTFSFMHRLYQRLGIRDDVEDGQTRRLSDRRPLLPNGSIRANANMQEVPLPCWENAQQGSFLSTPPGFDP